MTRRLLPPAASLLAASLFLTAAVSADAAFADEAAAPALTAGEPVRLFDGSSLDGWTPVLSDDAVDPATVWSAQDGVLSCTGKPSGYIRTEKEYADYKLSVQWRWTAKPGNNGVLVHTGPPNALGVWPRSQECQLFHENAGDIWVIGTEVTTPLEGVPGHEKMVRGRRHLNFNDGAEKPVGEWNTMEIVCRGDTITISVNGQVVNYGYDSTVSSGAISLQSEGAPIEYREIVLTPLK